MDRAARQRRKAEKTARRLKRSAARDTSAPRVPDDDHRSSLRMFRTQGLR